jgi:esterase/lipase superfamily enzyme
MLRSSPDREFHIANVVLVAPDLDGDVAIAKIFKVFSDPDLPFGEKAEPGAVLPPAPGLKVTLYVSPDDKAIAAASWLYGSIARLGRIDTTMFSADQIEAIASLRAVDIIEVRGTTDFFGHSYFKSNPRVSADIVAMLRYDLQPNEPGRPLEEVKRPFWRIQAGAPESAPMRESPVPPR